MEQMMARRSRSARPKTLTTLEAPTEKETPTRETPVKLGRTLEQEYAHIRGDLTRILILATLIFAGMFALRFVVGL
jgi:hypothetical protein